MLIRMKHNVLIFYQFNETQATGIPMKWDELELAGRIIPKAKRRDNFELNEII